MNSYCKVKFMLRDISRVMSKSFLAEVQFPKKFRGKEDIRSVSDKLFFHYRFAFTYLYEANQNTYY